MSYPNSIITSTSRLARGAATTTRGLFDVPGLDIASDTIYNNAGSTLHLQRTSNDTSSTNDTMTPNYSSGLAGVNLAMDQQFVRLIWVSIVVVALTVFVLRICQLYSAHVRHIYCLHADREQQNYWTFDKTSWWPWLKREIVYAPLGKKRHNREIQLSHAANYGTLPGRVHAFLLIGYGSSNLAYCLVLPWGISTPQIVAELRGRTGILATVNMIPLVLMAGRNNPAISLLKISFDTFNLFHRWIGRIVIVEATCHVLAWYVNYQARNTSTTPSNPFAGDPFMISGLFSMLAMAFILFQSLSPVRHAFYEIFLHLHIALAFTSICGLFIHLEVAKLPALPYARAVVVLWFGDRVARLLRIAYYNYSWGKGTTRVVVEALPSDACRVTFRLPRHITVRPGSHVYAYLPRISWWQSHPFSVAWTNVESEPPTGLAHEIDPFQSPGDPDKDTMRDLEKQSVAPSRNLAQAPTSISLVVAARAGMTRKLHEQAKRGPLHMRGFIEGPYAGHDSLSSYGTIVMFAGGAGITHHLVQIRHLLACARARTVATRKIVLVWTVRDVGSIAWIREWMDEVLNMPGRKDILTLELYVTRAKQEADYTSPHATMQLFPKRCDPGAVLDRVLPARVGATMVTICGPGAFADEVRAAVRSRIHLGSIDMNEESFTW